MFSGKTSRLIDIYKQCKFCNIPVSIINHTIDKRYHDTMLSTHDKVMAPCLQANKLSDIWTNSGFIESGNQSDKYANKLLRSSDVILINEGQFFPDLYEVVVDMLNNNRSKINTFNDLIVNMELPLIDAFTSHDCFIKLGRNPENIGRVANDPTNLR